MRKPLTEIQEIEQYLLHQLPAASRLVFQARMLVSPVLRGKVREQQKVLQLVRWLGREKQREKLDRIFQQLMKEESFNRSITSIFK